MLERDLNVQQASFAFAAAGFGVFVGSFVASVPLRVIAPRPLIVVCSLLGTTIVGASMALPVPTLWVFGLVFAGLFLNGVGNVAANLLLVDETPSRAGDNYVAEWGGAEPVIGNGRCRRRSAARVGRVRGHRLVTARARLAGRPPGVESASPVGLTRRSGQLCEAALVEPDVLLADGVDPAKCLE